MVDLPAIAAPAPLLEPAERRRAWLDMWLVDHGFIRDVYCNLHPVSPQAWRSAQPAPRHLRKAQRLGVKTVLNLRGRRDGCGAYRLEHETCAQLGLTLVDFPIRSRKALDRETLRAAADLFPTLDYPILMHCKSGADRAGFMATLYLHLHEGEPLDKAIRHLSLRYGHVRQAKTGVIDLFFRRLAADLAARPMTFAEWVDSVYDPAALNAAFKETWLAGLLVDKVLRRE